MFKILIIIIIILALLPLLLIFNEPVKNDDYDFKDWVKNPDMKEGFAQLLEEKQKQLAIEEQELTKYKKRINSFSATELHEEIKHSLHYDNTEEREILIARALELNTPSLWNIFKELYTHKDTYNAASASKGFVERHKDIDFKNNPFFIKLYELNRKLIFENTAMYFNQTESLQLMLSLNTEKFLNKYTDPKWLTTKNSELETILDVLLLEGKTLPLSQILKLYKECKSNPKDLSRSINPLLQMLHKLNYKDIEREAYFALNTLEIKSWDHSYIADIITAVHGIPDVDQYMEEKFKAQLKSSFPFEQTNPLVQTWCSIGSINGQVCNGGFAQYFSNGYGYQFLVALDSSKKLRLPKLGSILEGVKNIFLKDNPRSDFSDVHMAKIYDNVEKELSNWDEKFYEINRLDARLKLYLCSEITGKDLLSKLK